MNFKLQTPSPALPVQTSALLRQLDGLARDLRLPRERIENAFLDVGGKLGQCAAILGRISSVFEALPRDLESQELLEATQRLQAVGERAQLMAASFATEQDNIARLAQVVIAAERPIAELRKTVKMIGIVAINARVVAAGIVGDLDDFAVFTTDIATLSESAAQTIADFSRVYRQLTAEVYKADAQRLHFEATHKDTLTGLAERLIANLDEVTRRRQESAEGGAETGRLSRQISNRIATAVSALQVGDMTRQRVEHVESALQTLQDILSGSDAEILGDAALPGDWQSALVGAICNLQSQQLAGATEMFNREVVEAEEALNQLARDSKTVTDHSQQVYGNGDAKGASPLASLNAELGRAALVLADCEAERGKLDSVAADVEATVRVLLGHVEAVGEIEANMRLVSLNAAVKCAQLGPRGTALNVIAHQLRQLTGETVVSAKAAMSNLEEAGALAQSFHGASTGDRASRVRQLEEEATASMSLLATVEKRLAGALTILRDDGPRAVGLLGAAASGFSGHAEIAQSVLDIQNRIEALMNENGFDAEGAPVADGVSIRIFQKLRSRYTMESERSLHDRLFGAPPRQDPLAEETAEPVMDAAAEDDLDAIFF
jgi:hypothetical protein